MENTLKTLISELTDADEIYQRLEKLISITPNEHKIPSRSELRLLFTVALKKVQ